MDRSPLPYATVLPLVAVAALTPFAAADITGFDDPAQFAINQSDSAAGPTPVTGGIHITGQAAGEARSVFFYAPQAIGQFTASYTYQCTGTPTSVFGACFVIQNSGGGANTVAVNVLGGGTRFGFADFNGHFQNAQAASLEFGSLAAGSSSASIYQNGIVGGGSLTTAPVNLFSGHPINVSLSYNGTILSETMTDTVTGGSSNQQFFANIPSVVGGTTALVGFTAESGGCSTMDQYITNFQFTSVPAPSSLVALGSFGILAGRRRRK